MLSLAVSLPCFNPRTHVRVRLLRNCVLAIHGTFQSTHPCKGATGTSQKGGDWMLFQSTHPCKGATGWFLRCGEQLHARFNPRTHVRVRLIHSTDSFRLGTCFNPRTHVRVRRSLLCHA